ncbi:MAG: pantetheine-phosphate adenylyltransferase [Muribaculaceae bacterium]|nr:pantetheine-phosphate adenylyltransferase [Muribaculaceae bacterium]
MTRKYPDPAAPGERVALFPGSFNPFTIGHLDILRRGLRLFDRVIVVIGINSSKPAAHAEESLCAILRAIEHLPNADAMIWDGLTADAAKLTGARFLLRGVRSVADFEYERTLADTNAMIAPGLETVFIPARPELAALSSSMVRELSSYGFDVTPFIPSEKTSEK